MSLKTQANVLRALDEQRFLPSAPPSPSTSTSASSPPPTRTSKKRSPTAISAKTSSTASTSSLSSSRRCANARKTSPAGQGIPAGIRTAIRPPTIEISADALDALQLHHWPGNVRELSNLLERVLILNPQVPRIERKHLPLLVARSRRPPHAEDFPTLQQAREAYERDYILANSKSAMATSAAPPKSSASSAATSTAK